MISSCRSACFKYKNRKVNRKPETFLVIVIDTQNKLCVYKVNYTFITSKFYIKSICIAVMLKCAWYSHIHFPFNQFSWWIIDESLETIECTIKSHNWQSLCLWYYSPSVLTTVVRNHNESICELFFHVAKSLSCGYVEIGFISCLSDQYWIFLYIHVPLGFIQNWICLSHGYKEDNIKYSSSFRKCLPNGI